MNDSDREAARLRVFNRIRAANSQSGIERVLFRFDGIRRALSIATYAIAAWLYFHPFPYAAAVAAALLVSVCWIVLVRMLAVRGWGIELASLMILGLMLVFRAAMDVELVNPAALALPAAIVGGLAALALGAGRESRVWAISAMLFAMVSAGALLTLANVAFDHGEPKRFAVRVDSKRMSEAGYRRPATYFLHFAPAPGLASIDVREASVNKTLYDLARVGDVLCFRIHPGALRMRWYDVVPASRCRPA